MAALLKVFQLQPADVIVSTTDAAISTGIRSATGSTVSHAALYAGGGYIIEAIGEGVVKRPHFKALEEDILAIAYRRVGITTDKAKEVVSYAERYVGRPYDKLGAVGSGTTSSRGGAIYMGIKIISPAAGGVLGDRVKNNASDGNKDNAFFCSELVARAFELAGIPISDLPASYTNPMGVMRSSKLQFLGDLEVFPIRRD
jgi:cell wall-associated NlpC family hydrolase